MKSLNQMAVFVQVVEHGSFSKAAKHLGLGKSVVSSHVAALEARLGSQLLARSTRALVLTDDGEAFYAGCRQMVESAESALATIETSRTVAKGMIRLTSSYNFGSAILIELLTQFRALHPDVTIDLDLNDVFMPIIEERFDLAIRVGRLVDSGLVAIEIGQCRMMLCGSPAIARALGTDPSPERIAEFPLISIEQLQQPHAVRLVHESTDQQVNIELTPAIKTHSGLAAREFVRKGAGIAMLPDFSVASDLLSGEIVHLLPAWRDLVERPISVVMPTRQGLPLRVRLLVNFLRQSLGDRLHRDMATRRPGAGAG